MKKYLVSTLLIMSLVIQFGFSQGFNIPAKNWGLSFGNSTRFTGIRFNIIEKDIEHINGINFSVWQHKETERQTGTMNGIGIGLPLAGGTYNRNGISIGLAGVGAVGTLKGINLGGLGVGAGIDAFGINMGLLGAGTGRDLKGLNFGGLGVGSGRNLAGINIGGLGAGAGNNVSGFTIALLGVGAGNNLSGINIAGLGVGAGENLSGFNIGGLGVGAGGKVTGLNLSVLAVGAGEELRGISIAGLGTGSPVIKGIQVSLVSGGSQVSGITIAPAYFIVKGEEAFMKGLSASVFNHIQGVQYGVAIGVFNYAYSVKGIQLGLLNHVKNNPRGLRWLPIFNTNF